jgi:hypothetical protein
MNKKSYNINNNNKKKMLTKILDLFHGLIILIPIIIFFIPKLSFHKYVLLFIVLLPHHWVYFDDHCVLTKISKNYGGIENTETTSGFSETYLKWLYKPIMDLFGWEWNSKGLDKMVTLHWIINIILVWYYSFFYV